MRIRLGRCISTLRPSTYFNSTEFTGITTQGYTASGTVLTPTQAAFGVGNGESANPDGNLARHLQLSLRFTF